MLACARYIIIVTTRDKLCQYGKYRSQPLRQLRQGQRSLVFSASNPSLPIAWKEYMEGSSNHDYSLVKFERGHVLLGVEPSCRASLSSDLTNHQVRRRNK